MQLPSVCVLYLLRENDGSTEVLLGEKKTGLGAGKIVGVGGKVEAGENIRDAAARECREETGLVIDTSSLEHAGTIDYLFPHKKTWSQQSHVFVCRSWEGTEAESDEIAPRWFDIESIPYERMWDDAKAWLPRLLRGGQVVASFEFGADLNTVATAFVQHVEATQLDADL